MGYERSVICISDLHIGDGGVRDNFKERQYLLCAFLEECRTLVTKKNASLYILGDLFELWQSPISRVLKNNSFVLQALSELKATYLIGNHDIELLGLIADGMLNREYFGDTNIPFEVCEKPGVHFRTCEARLTIGGRAFVLKHGHDADRYNCGEDPSFGRALAILASLVEDAAGGTSLADAEGKMVVIEDLLEKIINDAKAMYDARAQRGWTRKALEAVALGCIIVSEMGANGKTIGQLLTDLGPLWKPLGAVMNGLTPAQKGDERFEIIQNLKKVRESNVTYVVGHTHEPGFYEDWYCNTGSWVNDTMDVLLIGLDGAPILKSWTRKGFEEREQPDLKKKYG